MTSSNLSVTVGGTEDFTEYQCFADNAGFFNQTSRIANLTRGCELKKWMDGWMDGRTDGRTDERTDRRMDMDGRRHSFHPHV